MIGANDGLLSMWYGLNACYVRKTERAKNRIVLTSSGSVGFGSSLMDTDFELQRSTS